MPFAFVKGLRINYEGEPARRKGKLLLFVHGASGSLNIWLEQLDFFSKEHTPIAMDLPGHGASEGSGADEIGGYRDFLKDFTDALSLPRFILCGHSMGGAIAIDFALHHPERLEALILVGSGARFSIPEESLEVFRKDPFTWSMAARSWIFSKKTPLSIIEAVEAETLKASPEVAYSDMRACARFDVSASLGEIRVPTLLLYGREDMLAGQAALLSSIPNSQVGVIEDAAHVPTVEQPDRFNAALAMFIGTLSP
ncbi:MAG: alpha/beta hydrolase [Dehalococcoidia bacterium]|nr:alpha/beta hydrolase [Dehalococcoidia bacterium]